MLHAEVTVFGVLRNCFILVSRSVEVLVIIDDFFVGGGSTVWMLPSGDAGIIISPSEIAESELSLVGELAVLPGCLSNTVCAEVISVTENFTLTSWEQSLRWRMLRSVSWSNSKDGLLLGSLSQQPSRMLKLQKKNNGRKALAYSTSATQTGSSCMLDPTLHFCLLTIVVNTLGVFEAYAHSSD